MRECEDDGVRESWYHEGGKKSVNSSELLVWKFFGANDRSTVFVGMRRTRHRELICDL
jgi:hypothetical protein